MRSRILVCCCVLLLGLLGTIGCSRKDPLVRLLEKGDQFYEAGDYQAASDVYKQVLLKSSDDPRALIRLGRVAYRQGRIFSAYILFQGTISKVPENADLSLVYGLTSHALGKTNDARIVAKKVLESQPTNEEALLMLVETCVTTRDNQETRRIIEQLAQKNPNAAIYHVALGELQAAVGEKTAAEQELRKALEFDPKSAAAHSRLGIFLIRNQERAKGAEELQQAAALSPLRSVRRINYINFLLEEGRSQDATRELLAITDKVDDYIPAWVIAMKLDFQLGKYHESEVAADKIISLDRANYDAWMQRVALKLRRNETDAVISDLKTLESFYDRSPEIKYQLALAYLLKNEVFSAEQSLQQALRSSPTDENAILLLAEIDLRKGNLLPPKAALQQLLQRRPQLSQAYILLAQAHRAAGEPEKGLAVLKTLAQSFPTIPNAPYRVGLAELEMGHTQEARAAFEQALKISDQYWPALEMVVEMGLVEKRIPETSARVEAAVQKYPKEAQPLLLRAKIRLAKNDPAGAEADLNQGIILDPKVSYPYLLLSQIYLVTGRLEQGVEKLTLLLKQKPSANVWTQLGMLYSLQRQFDKARNAYEQAVALDPEFSPALNNLANLYLDDPTLLEKAGDLIERAQKISPADPQIADTAGWIMVRKGYPENALRLLQVAAEKLPGSAEVQYHIGTALYYLGQDEPARLAFRNVLAAPGVLPFKKNASDRLAVMAIDPAKATPAERALLQDTVRQEPSDPAALARLAAIQAQIGDLPAAAKNYEAALKINPRRATTAMALAELYFGPLAKPERAKEVAKMARDASGRDGQIAWRLGQLLFTAGDFVTANALLQDALRNFADNASFQFDLARSQYSLGRIPDAEAALAKANADSANVSASRMAAMLAAAKTLKPSAQAIADAEKILQMEPDYVPALMVKATGAEQANKPQDAAASYERVLVIYPQFVPAMRLLATLYGNVLGDDAKADEWARKVLKISTEDPEANYQLGAVNFRKGDYAETVRYMKQTIRHRNDHAEAYYLLGLAYVQLKNNSEAQTALQRAITLGVPPQEASEAAKQLEVISKGRSF